MSNTKQENPQESLSEQQNSGESVQDKPITSIFKKIGLNHPILEHKTPFDRTPYSCAENILRGTIRSFLTAYGVKSGISLLKLLLNFKALKKNPAKLLEPLMAKGSFKTGFFATIMTFCLKLSVAIMRVIRKKDDGFNASVGGLIGGYLSMFLVSEKKVFLATFLLSRAVESIYHSMANRGLFKKRSVHWVLVYGFGMMLIGYSFANERYLMDKGAMNGLTFLTQQSPQDWGMTHFMEEMKRRKLLAGGFVSEPWLKN